MKKKAVVLTLIIGMILGGAVATYAAPKLSLYLDDKKQSVAVKKVGNQNYIALKDVPKLYGGSYSYDSKTGKNKLKTKKKAVSGSSYADKVASVYAGTGVSVTDEGKYGYIAKGAGVQHVFTTDNNMINFYIDRVGTGANYTLAAKAVAKLTGAEQAKLLAGIKKVSTGGGTVTVGKVTIKAGRTIYLAW